MVKAPKSSVSFFCSVGSEFRFTRFKIRYFTLNLFFSQKTNRCQTTDQSVYSCSEL